MEKLTSELNVELSIPPMKYCTDNATMIAAAGYYAYLDGRRADLTLNSKSQDNLKAYLNIYKVWYNYYKIT